MYKFDACTAVCVCDCICSSEPPCNMAVYGVSMILSVRHCSLHKRLSRCNRFSYLTGACMITCDIYLVMIRPTFLEQCQSLVSFRPIAVLLQAPLYYCTPFIHTVENA